MDFNKQAEKIEELAKEAGVKVLEWQAPDPAVGIQQGYFVLELDGKEVEFDWFDMLRHQHKSPTPFRKVVAKEIGLSKSKTSSGDFQGWEVVPPHEIYEKKVKQIAYTVLPESESFKKLIRPFYLVGNDAYLRPIYGGVNFTDTRAEASDSHRAISFPYSGTRKGIINLETGEDVDGNFPKLEAVIPEIDYTFKVNLRKLKTYCEILQRVGLVSKITNQAQFYYPSNNKGEKTEIGLNIRFLIEIAETFLKIGDEEVYINLSSDVSRAVVFSQNPISEKKGVWILCMPVMTDGVAMGVTSVRTPLHHFYTEESSVPDVYEFGFDLETGNVVGKNFKQIDLPLNPKPKGAMQGGLDVKLFKKLRTAFKMGKNTLPILDRACVKDKTLIVSNLVNTLEIFNVNLPDGLYDIQGDSLFLDTTYSIDDFPEVPTGNKELALSVNLDEFLYHFEKAAKFVGKDELRPVMMGVHINDTKVSQTAEIVSTDAHTMYRQKLNDVKKEKQFGTIDIQAPKILATLSKFLECDYISISKLEGNNVVIDCEDFRLTMRYDGKYPNYDGVWGFDRMTKEVSINVKKLQSIKKWIEDFIKKGKENDDVEIIYNKYILAFSQNKISLLGQDTVKRYETELKSWSVSYLVAKDVDSNADEDDFELLQMPMMLEGAEYDNVYFSMEYTLAKRILTTLKKEDIRVKFNNRNQAYFIDGYNDYKHPTKKKAKAAPKKAVSEPKELKRLYTTIYVHDASKPSEHYSFEAVEVNKVYNHQLTAEIQSNPSSPFNKFEIKVFDEIRTNWEDSPVFTKTGFETFNEAKDAAYNALKTYISQYYKIHQDPKDKEAPEGYEFLFSREDFDNYYTPFKELKNIWKEEGYDIKLKDDFDSIDVYGKPSVAKESVYVTYMNKDKGFQKDRKYFDSYEEAEKWARKEFDKFDPDMISYGEPDPKYQYNDAIDQLLKMRLMFKGKEQEQYDTAILLLKKLRDKL